ncbi:MAG: YceI family protein [Bacteroidetes bacterium]|nr:YceI family protein [Bacteroidota bacterium]
MKKLLFIAALIISSSTLFAQQYVTKTGHIKFFSEMPAENIEAHNRQVNSALNITTAEFAFRVLIKSFEFEKSLMQEHFNENYLESDKYPNATFKGKVMNISDIDCKTNGKYDAVVSGDLSIHGVTNKITEKGTFTVKDGEISGFSVFHVELADYQINIPKMVASKISPIIEITVDVLLKEYKK